MAGSAPSPNVYLDYGDPPPPKAPVPKILWVLLAIHILEVIIDLYPYLWRWYRAIV